MSSAFNKAKKDFEETDARDREHPKYRHCNLCNHYMRENQICEDTDQCSLYNHPG